MKEEQEEVKRREEEFERRRMARLMEDLNEDKALEDAKKRKRPTFEDTSNDGDISDRDDDRVLHGFDEDDEFDSAFGDEDEDDLERDIG